MKKHKTDAGIYGILNTWTGRIYIGKSKNLRTRYNMHLHLLRNNRHFNKDLQEDFRMFGEKTFRYIIVEKCSNTNQREKYWILQVGGVKSKMNYNRSKGNK
jgi:group I intron endonuclease